MTTRQSKPKREPPPPADRPRLDFGALDLAALDEQTARTAGEPLHVPFSEVYEDPNQPRTEFREDEIQAIAADIELRGILQPIVTWPRDDRGFKIRYGAKRRRAAEIASARTGVMTVPIVVYGPSPNLDDYAQVSENRQRSDITPMDLARFIHRKIQQDKHSAAEVARRIGVDKSVITHHLALLDHPEPILALYRTGRSTSARNLWELGNLYREHKAEVEAYLAETQDEITRTSIRQLAAWLNGRKGDETSEGIAGSPTDAKNVGPSNADSRKGDERGTSKTDAEDPNVTKLVNRMQDHYGTKVRLAYNTSGKGTVTFSFFSLDELQGLLEKWKFPRDED